MRILMATLSLLVTMLLTTQTQAQVVKESHAEIRFDTIDVPGATDSTAGGINNRGVIVGSAGAAGAFVAIDDLIVRLQGPDLEPLVANAINDRGHVAGYNQNTLQGFFLANGVLSPIEVPGSRDTIPLGINNRGHIVGFAHVGENVSGFLSAGGKYATIQFPGSLVTRANGINDRAQIVGDFAGDDGFYRGFLWSRGRFTTIEVPNSGYTRANDINNLGQIVGGTASQPDADMSGFLLWKDRFTIIHIPGSSWTEVRGINDHGRIVGYYVDDIGVHGFEADVYQFVGHQ